MFWRFHPRFPVKPGGFLTINVGHNTASEGHVKIGYHVFSARQGKNDHYKRKCI
jgi:hypothetical protein